MLEHLKCAVCSVAESMKLDPSQMGSDGKPEFVYVPPLKTMQRMDEKAGVGLALGLDAEADHALHEYPRQASNVDVARIMLILPSPSHVIEALALFKSQTNVVRVKNRFSAPTPAGLRDLLLNLCIDGVYCEVQVGITTLVAVRRKMHSYYGICRSIGMKPLKAMAKPLTVSQVSEGLPLTTADDVKFDPAAVADCARAAIEGKQNEAATVSIAEDAATKTFPFAALIKKPCPDGVDPRNKHLSLTEAEFLDVLKMSKDEFAALPQWKQDQKKKEVQLF